MIDLNEEPEEVMPEFAFVHDMNILHPLYCTQQSIPLGGADNAEFVAESPNAIAT